MTKTTLDGRAIMAQLQHDGWIAVHTSKNHFKLYSPCGKHLVITSGGWGPRADRQVIRNLLRDLKRAGWEPQS